MKISPMASNANTVGALDGGGSPTPTPQTRVVQFKVNRTPGDRQQQPLTISDPNEGAATGDEATQPISPQFAALAKQRRALQVKERELAERQKELESRSSTQGGGVDLARLKAEPLSVLLEAGVTYDQLTEAILSDQGGTSSELAKVRAEMKALKEGFDQTLSAKEQAQETQVLAEMQREAASLIATGEEFEMIRVTKSLPDVMTLIKRTYKETGEVLDVTEALKLVEDQLLEDATPIARLQKVQGRLAPQPYQQMPQQQRQMRTLTSRDTAPVPLTPKQRAIMAFQGQLKR